MFKKIYEAFDKFEDVIRAWLSRRTIIYALIGGTGVVLFWRGVWHLGDFLMALIAKNYTLTFPWWDGPLSIAIGVMLLLSTGLMVSTFIGNEVIISGLKKEKKIAEKTEEEVEEEIEKMESIKSRLREILVRLTEIEEKISKR